MIRRLAETLWSASRKESRIARTVVLKLKTGEFKIINAVAGCWPTSGEYSSPSRFRANETSGISFATRSRMRIRGRVFHNRSAMEFTWRQQRLG
jgi:hypothetical protein